MINVALPKGRLGEKIYAKFEEAGYECPSIKENNRKLIFENAEKGIRYFWVKPSDVSIYVERGAADIGVCGKDILAEYAPNVYELLDLKKIGITLSSNGAMQPASSVSGLMIAHPKARYFSIGDIGEDQLRDYALRRGLSMEKLRSFLASNL